MHSLHRAGLPLVAESKNGIGDVILVCFDLSSSLRCGRSRGAAALSCSDVDNGFPSILHCQHREFCFGGRSEHQGNKGKVVIDSAISP